MSPFEIKSLYNENKIICAPIVCNFCRCLICYPSTLYTAESYSNKIHQLTATVFTLKNLHDNSNLCLICSKIIVFLIIVLVIR